MTARAGTQVPTASYQQYRSQLVHVHGLATELVDLTRNVTQVQLASLHSNLVAQRQLLIDEFDISPSGIQRAARQEEDDVSYDLGVEHPAILGLMDAAITEAAKFIAVAITPAETADLKTSLDALGANIIVA